MDRPSKKKLSKKGSIKNDQNKFLQSLTLKESKFASRRSSNDEFHMSPPPNMDLPKKFSKKSKKTILKAAFDSKKQSKVVGPEYDDTEAIRPTVFALNLDDSA